jgi:hypothetical protein
VIILPLIERELRVRARSRAVYWTRFAVGLVGFLICLPALVQISGPSIGTRAVMGASAFNRLVGTAFLPCCCAGFLAVEGISRERREGTLGLLFLTRVGAFDVLLGIFGAVGLTCLCALAAVLPVLILPVLIGGVTGGEAARTVLVLFDTLLLSLAVGLWAAARGRGWLESARQAALLLVLVVVAPVLIPFAGGLSPLPGSLALPSPLYALQLARDARYSAGPSTFWSSVAAVHGMSWLFLIAAGNRLRRTMRGEDGALESPAPAVRKRREEAREPVSFVLYRWEIPITRPRRSDAIEDGTDPLDWLLRRRRGIKAAIWAAALVDALHRTIFSFLVRSIGGGFLSVSTTSLAISVVQACLFAWAASRFFVEGRRTGELELLLTTPAGADRIVSSQWIWLRRTLLLPVTLMVAPYIVSTASTLWQLSLGPPQGFWSLPSYVVFQMSFLSVNTIIGVVALFWAGLWSGFKARSQAAAVVRTLVLAKGAPYLIGLLGNLLIMALFSVPGGGFFSLIRQWMFLLPTTANLLYFLWLWRWARRRLRAEIGHQDTARFNWPQFVQRAFSAKALYK